MAMQPINPNDSLDITHALYAGTTGAGKSVATQKAGLIKATDQVVLWDMYGQYRGKTFLNRKVRTYDNLKDFFNAVYAGRKTNQGFKIAFTPKESKIPTTKGGKRELFLKYCSIVWGMGNGKHKKTLHCVMEEINRVTTTSGDEDSIYGEMLEVGRKFNLMLHNVSQRLAPIPNTVIAMCGYKWVGVQEMETDVNRISTELGISKDDIRKLKKRDYYLKSPGFGNVKKSKLVFH